MKQINKSETRVVLLGFCYGAVPIVAEVAFEALNCNRFDIVKNIEVKELNLPYKHKGFQFNVFNDYSFDFKTVKDNVVFGVSTPHIKYVLYQYFNRLHNIDKSRFASLIHPSAYFSMSAIHEEGLLLEPLSVVSVFSKIGFGVTIKRNCSVGHHVVIEDYVSIHPGVNISSNVRIGKGVTLGTGTSVIDYVDIGENSFIGSGSVITKSIPDGVVAYGNPCRVVRNNDTWTKVDEQLKVLGVIT